VLTILALAHLRWNWLPVAWAGLLVLAWSHDPVKQLREYGAGVRETAQVRALISSWGPDVSVSADERVGPVIANRWLVTRFPDFSQFPDSCPDWVLVPSSSGAYSGWDAYRPCLSRTVKPR
jgi:hypothetical protein